MLRELSLRPMNLNQLAEKMGVDYRTVMHHASVLKANSLVVVQGEKYGATYFLSPRLQHGLQMFLDIASELKLDLEGGEK